jgi:hypothetical protein
VASQQGLFLIYAMSVGRKAGDDFSEGFSSEKSSRKEISLKECLLYTRRYCLKCKEVTSWMLDKRKGHSRCVQCGGSKSRKPKGFKLIK